jgi:hypothetical protein
LLGRASKRHRRNAFPRRSSDLARLDPRVQDGPADQRRDVSHRKYLVHQVGFVKLEPDLDNLAQAGQARG